MCYSKNQEIKYHEAFINRYRHLFLLFTLFSCGNLNAGKTDATTGSIRIIIPDAERTVSRDVGIPSQSQVTGYQITLLSVSSDDSETPLSGFPTTLTAAEASEGKLYTGLTPGKYRISLTAYIGTLQICTGKTGDINVTAGDEEKVTLQGHYYLAWLNDETNTSSPELLLTTQIPGTYTPVIPTGWAVPTGKQLWGWEDAAGNTYEANQPIDLHEKTLPLELTAVWETTDVTYTFNPNYTGDGAPAATGSRSITRDANLLIPDYWQVSVYNNVTLGVFEDENFMIEDTGDEQAYRIEYDAASNETDYYFCGWSVNESLPVLNDANYQANLAALKNAVIVQPGDKITMGDDTTAFYAVWACSDLSDRVIDVRYQWGDGRTTATWTIGSSGADFAYTGIRTNAHVYYLVDNVRNDSGTDYTSYTIPLTMPSVHDIFPQYDDITAEIITSSSWNNAAYTAEGNTINLVTSNTSGKKIFKWDAKTPLVYINNRGSWYSQNRDVDYVQCEETFPVYFPDNYFTLDWDFMKKDGFVPTYDYDSEDPDNTEDIYSFSSMWYTKDGEVQMPIYVEDPYGTLTYQYEDDSGFEITDMQDGEPVIHVHPDKVSLPLNLNVEWELSYEFYDERIPTYNAFIIYSLDDIRDVENNRKGTFHDFYDTDGKYYDENEELGVGHSFFLGKSLLIEDLDKPLFEGFYTSWFIGLGNVICIDDGDYTETIADARAPLFGTITNYGDMGTIVSDLVIMGTFGDYSEEWAGDNCGVLCNTCESAYIQNITFEGTAKAPITGIFGRQITGLEYCTNCTVTENSSIGNIPLYCPSI